MKKRIALIFLCVAMVLLLFAGCGDISKQESDNGGKAEISEEEKLADITADFSAELLKKVALENKQKNIVISPMSVLLALSMTANGAQGETLEEMEGVLSSLPISELNELLGKYIDGLEELDVANAVFVREDIANAVKEDFRAACVDSYDAEVFCEDFDSETVDMINEWVKERTDGMIDNMIDELSPDTVMLLLNALCFDGEWKEPFDPDNVISSSFLGLGGSVKSVDYMISTESKYIKTEYAEGFIKDYDGRLSFVGLLPESYLSVYDYISMMDGELIANAINSAAEEDIKVWLPKFSYDSELLLNSALSDMGMPSAFNRENADFTGIAEFDRANLFISKVLHKATITVGAEGTCAAAATGVHVELYSSMNISDINLKRLVFERPFVYMIIDRETGIPVFVGVVTEPDPAEHSGLVVLD